MSVPFVTGLYVVGESSACVYVCVFGYECLLFTACKWTAILQPRRQDVRKPLFYVMHYTSTSILLLMSYCTSLSLSILMPWFSALVDMATAPHSRDQLLPVHLLTREKQIKKCEKRETCCLCWHTKGTRRIAREALSFKTSVIGTMIVSHSDWITAWWNQSLERDVWSNSLNKKC